MIVGVCRLIANHLQPHHLRKRTRSQGPLLHRRYPASTLIRPCPTPAVATACRDAEAATLANNGSPPITRTTFPTCRAHYPGGSSGCACRLLPHPCSLPQMAGGSASALSLSRPAQASLALRPAGSLSRPRRPLSRGSDPDGYPTKPLVSYRTYRQLSGWIPPPQVFRAFGAHCQFRSFARVIVPPTGCVPASCFHVLGTSCRHRVEVAPLTVGLQHERACSSAVGQLIATAWPKRRGDGASKPVAIEGLPGPAGLRSP